jgi:hypothetical protein
VKKKKEKEREKDTRSIVQFFLNLFAAGVYLPEGRHPIIPFFQHSIIPINCERSEPKFLGYVF